METKKITKKNFIELLSNNKSIFLGSYFNLKSDPIDIIKNGIQGFNPEPKDERRTVKAVKSNGLLFSNGSFLGFNQEGEKSYHMIGENFVCQITRTDYDNDPSCNYEGIVYSFVVYYVEY